MICNKPFLSQETVVNVGSTGYKSVVLASKERQDALFPDDFSIQLPLKLHRDCRRDYTNQLRIKAINKRKLDAADKCSGSTPPKLRSTYPPFNMKQNCLLCSKVIAAAGALSNTSPEASSYSEVQTIEFLESLLQKAQERNDDWAEEVLTRVRGISDLVAAEAKYHRKCLQYFHNKRGNPCTTASNVNTRGRPRKTEGAFNQLCSFLDENDECQYSLHDLKEIMDKYLQKGEEGCTSKCLKYKLEERYGTDIIITEVPGKSAVVSFKDLSHKILQEKWTEGTSGNSKEKIIEMAASFILDDIRTSVYDLTQYPEFANDEEDEMVPESLAHFLQCIIKSKSTDSKIARRRQSAISHAIIAACRPRSFISPILLSLAMYVHRKYESKELIGILSSLGFSDNYTEVRRLSAAFLNDEKPEYPLSGFTQFVFDNADFNVATLTGHNTVHILGGIASVTPAVEIPRKVIPRSTEMPDIIKLGKFGNIPIKHFTKPCVAGLKATIMQPLEAEKDIPLSLKRTIGLHYTWLIRFPLSPSPCWSGFMQTVVRGDKFDQSRIVVLPFINLDPGDLSTLYTALCFAQGQCDSRGIQFCPITFDQPLYVKAVEIVESSHTLKQKLFVRLGGFHLLMSYMGSIGNIMAGSGLEVLWEQVYAGNSVSHMMTGKAYSRALRAHFLTSSALVSFLVTKQEVDIDLKLVEMIHKQLLEREINASDLDDNFSIQRMVKEIDEITSEHPDDSRTLMLWKSYFKMSKVACLFLFSERAGDWKLQKHCLKLMIPIFHAAGHLAYAKCTRLMLQQMDKLKSRVPEQEYKQFTEGGYFTIRRKNIYFNGNFSDQTIEQDLMRPLKAPGGLSHGRGITESIISQWVHSIPYCIPICQYLEEFTGVFSTSSEQHKDLRPTTQNRDLKDVGKFVDWFDMHSPLSYTEKDKLVSIATGEVADLTVNCDKAYIIGAKAAEEINGKDFTSIKLRRNDKVVSFSFHKHKVTIRGQTVDIKPSMLFNRITCVLNTSTEMETYLSYELSQYPPSLFKDGLMRKNTKGQMGILLLEGTLPQSVIPESSYFVVDGGYLLRKYVWFNESTYLQICQGYINFIINNYGHQCSVVFDGYDSSDSTKQAEQLRRAAKGCSRDILVERNMKCCVTQDSFLANSSNKSRLITLLREECSKESIHTEQAEADADYLIASRVITKASDVNSPVILVANDTDILVLLVKHAIPLANTFMMKESNPVTLYNIKEIQDKIAVSYRELLLVVHCLTGCDTTSAFFRRGKRKGYNTLMKMNTADLESLRVFTLQSSSKEDIAKSGEAFYLKLYGATTAKTLDRQRYLMYLKLIKAASLKTEFSLESLPPTCAAARHNSYRVYHAVQQNEGHKLPPTDYGWMSHNGHLIPFMTDKPIAPDSLLKIISCGCKCGCNKKSCGCRKLKIACSAMCSTCNGELCGNTLLDYIEDTDG